MRAIALVALLLLQASPDKVTVRTAVDRTAVWVGDRVTYSIDLTCAPDIDILTEDLAADRLQLDGLEVVASSINKNDTHYSAIYEFAVYGVDKPSLEIQDTVIRYFRKGAATPEGEVKVPAITIAFRSTLPDGQESYPLRDAPRGADGALVRWYTRAGLAAMGLSGAVLVVLLMMAVQRKLRSPHAPRKRVPVRGAVDSLDKLQHMDSSTIAARRDAFTSLDVFIRTYLENQFAIRARALTSGEIDHGLAAILRDCEQARYCPDDLVPTSDDWQRTLSEAQHGIEQNSPP